VLLFAYVTVMSKNLVVIEYPGVREFELRVAFPRRAFSARSREYGNSACG